MVTVRNVLGREILDSRGSPTVEAEVTLSDGSLGRASVPSGASTGIHEAVELRDGGKRYRGLGVKNAVGNITRIITPTLLGKAFTQSTFDHTLIELDGTDKKSKLGANAILAVSLAFAKATALSEKTPLWKYFNKLSQGATPSLPKPQVLMLEGGKHADHSSDFQEFMITPKKSGSFAESIRIASEIYHSIGTILKEKGFSMSVGFEGAYSPNLGSNEQVFSLIIAGIERASYKPGEGVAIAIDCAASEFFEKSLYRLKSENKLVSEEELILLYKKLCNTYPIYSIEDGLAQDSWKGWASLMQTLGKQTHIVGDDLTVTNTKRLEKAIQEKAINALIIKPNQIGTLTETAQAITRAHKAGIKTIVSHRAGETEDTTIAHLAVGFGSEFIKTGAPSRGERTAKYNELLRIEETF